MQQLSREILLCGAAREGKEPQNRKQWDEAGSSSVSGVEEPSDRREDGSKLENRRAEHQAPVHFALPSLQRIWFNESRPQIHLEDLERNIL